MGYPTTSAAARENFSEIWGLTAPEVANEPRRAIVQIRAERICAVARSRQLLDRDESRRSVDHIGDPVYELRDRGHAGRDGRV